MNNQSTKRNQNQFHEQMRAELAFNYYRHIGCPDDLEIIASFSKTNVTTIERWRDQYEWEKKLQVGTSSYTTVNLDRSLREELLKDVGLIGRGLQKYMLTMFQTDELTGEFIIDEYGELMLQPYLIITKASDMATAVKIVRSMAELKLNVIGGMVTKDENKILDRIVKDREDKGWDVYRTMRECETVLGKIPEFLRLEATNKRDDSDEEFGDVEIHINTPGSEDAPIPIVIRDQKRLPR